MDPSRSVLLEVFDAAVKAVNGRRCVRRYLERHPMDGRVTVVAIGKAAAAMTAGALEALGEQVVSALVLTKRGHCRDLPGATPGLRCLESSHPVPDASSLAAGEALLQALAATPADAPLLFLISGGASSLVEAPAPGIDAAQLARVNDWLLGSGLSIHAMNRVRKAISRIKAGRLAGFLGGRPTRALMISDVPGDAPASIGSGLLVRHQDEALDTRLLDLPAWLRALLDRAPPLPDAAAFDCLTSAIVANNTEARAAAARCGRALGLSVHGRDEILEGDAVETGRRLAGVLANGPPGLHVWGGETTVRLPPDPGRGGRCQSLALAAAMEFQGCRDLFLLAGGSDGGDGPGEDAGALVDGGSVQRGADEGLDAARHLARADAGAFLEASGDLVHTGPTGTNVMDLVLGLKV